MPTDLLLLLLLPATAAARLEIGRRGVIARVCLAGSCAHFTPAAAAPARADATAAERWLGGPAPGLFPDCSAACVSSQDDRPSVWDNPWIAEEEPRKAMKRLRSLVEKKFGGRVVLEDDRYLAAQFVSRGPLGGEVVDDAEWYFAPNDVLVQFRAARRGETPSDFGANRDRMEKLRIALGWEKVEVLRNRRRALVVVESPFDSFGPATYDRDEYGFTNRDLVPVSPTSLPSCHAMRKASVAQVRVLEHSHCLWLIHTFLSAMKEPHLLSDSPALLRDGSVGRGKSARDVR